MFWVKNYELQKKFSTERVENEKKLDKYLSYNKGKFTKEQIKEMRSKLAGFAGNIPVFLVSDDYRANKSANIIPLQDGSLMGLIFQLYFRDWTDNYGNGRKESFSRKT